MSIQWTFIAGFLYLEIAVVIIMLLPIFSPRKWNQFFKSRLFFLFQQHAAMYFYVLLGVLCLFLLDAVREMKKYSNSDSTHVHLAAEMKGSVKLFRAQRNFYITGFSIFLAFVIRRIVTMLIIQNELTTKSENIIKEAEATVKLARQNLIETTLQATEAIQISVIEKQLEDCKQKLDDEKKKSKNFEAEAEKWRFKFLEVNAQIDQGDGKGDEI